jgi:hypothetical protein
MLVITSTAIKPMEEVEIIAAPIITTTSLGEGGNTFSINEKKKRIKQIQTGSIE